MTLCKTCPFVDGPHALAYDDDALDALDAGNEPSCHQIVGTEQIFVDGTPCDGFVAWCQGLPGFKRPQKVGAA